MIIGIYKITSPKNRVYIGQSIDIKKRFSGYKRLDSKAQIRLYNSFLKYGVVNHKFEIIIECDINQLNDLERFYQDLYNVLDKNGLNCRLQGTDDRSGKSSDETCKKIGLSKKGFKHSDESKLKIGLASKGKLISEEHKLKISEAQKGNKSCLGKTHSDETKLKLSNAHKGKILSAEHKLKMSESAKGKIMSDAHKLKISNAHIGKTHTKETKLKMSEAQKLSYINKKLL